MPAVPKSHNLIFKYLNNSPEEFFEYPENPTNPWYGASWNQGEFTIYDTRDRAPVHDPTAYPCNHIGFVSSVFGSGSGYNTGNCLMIYPGIVLTAAHCIYKRVPNRAWATSVHCNFPGYGYFNATALYCPVGYKDHDKPTNWDYGLITLNSYPPFQQFPIISAGPDKNTLESLRTRLIAHIGNVMTESFASQRLSVDVSRMAHRHNTVEGDSGAPMLVWNHIRNSYYLMGLHRGESSALRIIHPIVYNIISLINTQNTDHANGIA